MQEREGFTGEHKDGLPVEDTAFGKFAPRKVEGGFEAKVTAGGSTIESKNLDELRYHWYAARQGKPLDGAEGTVERLKIAKRAAEANEACPVDPDPREEAREWGIALPY